ncbi:glycerate kinase [Copidosoma floridanum]|uniref:glycerate kinase n=1 Tax=Copidosoma floridanum TaxID=29053 RepID=UPI000C6FAAB0|nr:glycerate kinase [Copidosoma floridanum]
MDVDANLSRTVKSELRQVVDESLSSVMPSVLIKKNVRYDGSNLIVNGLPYPLNDDVHIVGFGKAVGGMAYMLADLLGPRLKGGILSVPELMSSEPKQLQMLKRSKIIEYREGAKNNQPDHASYSSTKHIIKYVQNLGKKDTLVLLISGGGSALLFAPKPPMTFEEKRDLCKRLQNSGASIGELNVVRKQMSRVKGGGLALMAYPAKVLALILSDVVGDHLEIIASGPTCPTPEGNRVESINILKRYNLYHTLSEEVRREIFEKVYCLDTSLISNGKFNFVENIIIGNNESALEASAKAAQKLDLEGVILSNKVEGNVKDVSVAYAQLAESICHALDKGFSNKEDFIAEISKHDVSVLNLNKEKLEKAYEAFTSLREGKGVLLLIGGEPTVVVEGDGKGGRNQELALQFSLDWLSQIAKKPELSRYFVEFLSIATDGQDGPTDAAGAFGKPGISPKMKLLMQDLKDEKKKTFDTKKLQAIDKKIQEVTSMLPENVLQRNDTYSFYSKFENGKNHLITGPTGTNVMDLNYIYLRKRDCDCDIPGVIKINTPVEVNNFLFDQSEEGCEKDE